MGDIKVNYEKAFSQKYNRDYYRGRSFHYSGHWVAGMHYHNDDYHVDFVSHENTMLVCTKSHTSTPDNMPRDFIRDDIGNIIGIKSQYWDVVVSSQISCNVDIEILVKGGSTMLKEGMEVDLEAHLYKNGIDVTDRTLPNYFSWERSSADETQDRIWNLLHDGVGPNIHITRADVNKACIFSCIVPVSIVNN